MMKKTSVSLTDDLMLYFAYAANLDKETMSQRCPKSRPLHPTRLMGHSLRIALPKIFPSGPGWATTVPEKGPFVPGLLYLLHEDDLFALDDYEDYPTLYVRREVNVESDQGRERAMIYQMTGPLRYTRPTPEYAQIIRRGYRENNLPMAVLESAMETSLDTGT